MRLLYHLSDLHLRVPARSAQLRAFESLAATLAGEHEARGGGAATVVVTGDVFDSATDPPGEAVSGFLELFARIREGLGPETRGIVIPGNHDRRRDGLIGPHRRGLFDALGAACDTREIFVGGRRTPFLADIVPKSFHGLPAHVVAYDSSYLPRGLVSAGGTIREEDLLAAHAALPRDDEPVIVLMHHHLIPAPLTDVSGIDAAPRPGFARWLLKEALPSLVSHSDREELTMTALGAGSGLATLQAFDRAVLLLHGHKHVPSARLVRGLVTNTGDLLIASAGSAGKRERIEKRKQPEAARLWPSFNVIELEQAALRIDVVSFPPKRGRRVSRIRPLVDATRVGSTWQPRLVAERGPVNVAPVALDQAEFTLSTGSRGRFSYECERRVELEAGAKLKRYVDFTHAIAGARFGPGEHVRGKRGRRRVELALGTSTRYRADDALARTLGAGEKAYGAGAAFEWVGLLCRYGAREAHLEVRASELGAGVFGSVTDLQTGRETPHAVTRSGDAVRIVVHQCMARTLLRLHWPLTRE